MYTRPTTDVMDSLIPARMALPQGEQPQHAENQPTLNGYGMTPDEVEEHIKLELYRYDKQAARQQALANGEAERRTAKTVKYTHKCAHPDCFVATTRYDLCKIHCLKQCEHMLTRDASGRILAEPVRCKSMSVATTCYRHKPTTMEYNAAVNRRRTAAKVLTGPPKTRGRPRKHVVPPADPIAAL